MNRPKPIRNKALPRPAQTARQRTVAETWLNTINAPYAYRVARAWELVPIYMTLSGLALLAVVVLGVCVASGVVTLS